MILQMSDALAHAMLDQIETLTGPSAVLRMYSGSPPTNCGASPTGNLLATVTLAVDWADAAASRQKIFRNMPINFVGSGAGTQNLGWWGLWNNGATARSLQGDITTSGGGGSMIVDALSLANGQTGTVTSWSIAAGNGP
jgi:hypothetical protein